MFRKQQLLVLVGVLYAPLACGTKNNSDDDFGGTTTGGSIGQNGVSATGSNGDALGGSGMTTGATNGTDNSSGQGTGGMGAGNATGGKSAAGAGSSAGGATATGTDAPDSCSAFSGRQTGVVLEFDLDNTGSMSAIPSSNTCGTKWECSKKAFGEAVPTFPAGYAVGLTYYHVATGGNCTDNVQGVEIGVIAQGGANDPQVQQLLNSTYGINNEKQIQMTPSNDAWMFAADHLHGWSAAGYENASKYVVVMTDGVPTVANGCTTANLECKQGATGNDGVGIGPTQYQAYIENVRYIRERYGIKTYFIGVPGSELTDQVTCAEGVKYDPRSMLSALATAGGTEKSGCSDAGVPYYCHIDLSNGSVDFAAALTNTLNVISTMVASCTYAAPTLDLSMGRFVNHLDDAVYLTQNGIETRVARSEGCLDASGWDFSDATQSTIQLCSSLCDALKSTSSMSLRVEFGCSTVG